MIQLPLTHLPAGSTIILSTTSPDKRAEYEQIFKRFDVNFIFLDDLGLSPQKTDEMTNRYDGNLLQKAEEVSLALFANLDAITQTLRQKGFDVQKPIVGMVEDSGISIYPKDRKRRAAFNEAFKKLIEQRIHIEFEKEGELKSRTFSGMDADAVDNYLYNMFQNNHWMIEVGGENSLPGPNFKPIFEALHGGLREIYDVMYLALQQIATSPSERQSVFERRRIRFLNHCSMMLVPPSANPKQHLTAFDIVTGENKGWLKSHKEMENLFARRSNPKIIAHQAGEFFNGDMLIPDGQTHTSNMSQQNLIDEGMLWTKNAKRAHYYRLAAVGFLKEKYDIPIAPRYAYDARVSNLSPLSVMVLYSGQTQPLLATHTEQLLRDLGYDVTDMPAPDVLLKKPNTRLMQKVDVVLIIASPHATNIDNAQLLLGATVDKQVMPSAKEKTIIVVNSRNSDKHGAFDVALKMIRHAKISGLKNGLSEVSHIVEIGLIPEQEAMAANRLMAKLDELFKVEDARKRHRLTDVVPIQAEKHQPEKTVPPIPLEQFSVFVAGGAANEYPLFKAPANQLGRFIYLQNWVLVTGAGQKEGPMGAIHSGFVEAFLGDVLNNKERFKPKDIKTIHDVLSSKLTDIIHQKGLRGEMAIRYFNEVMQAIYHNPDAEYLAHHAPELLERLLQPREGTRMIGALGSLKQQKRMIGYSMPPLLISEGSGKWPLGMNGYNSGNMQRRMDEMLASAAHVFLTGGQGTYQEVIESVKLALVQRHSRASFGLAPKPICLLDQPVYKDGIYSEYGTVFRPVIEVITDQLAQNELVQSDIGLTVFHDTRKMELFLQQYQQTIWNKEAEKSYVAKII